MKHLSVPSVPSIRRLRIGLGILLLGLVVLSIYFTRQPAAAQCGTSTSSCKNCHEVQGQDPVSNNGEWHTAHAFGDFCEFCHAGTVEAKTQDEAHAGLVDPMVDVQASCQSCHPQDYKDKALVYAGALGIQLGDGGSGGSGGAAGGAGSDSGATGGGTSASTAGDTGAAANTAAASADAAGADAAGSTAAAALATDMGAAPSGELVDYNQLYAESIAPEKTLTTGDWILVGLIALLLAAFVVAVWKLEHWGDRFLHWWQTNILPPSTLAYGGGAAGAALMPMPSLGGMAPAPTRQPPPAAPAVSVVPVAAALAPAELEDLYRRRPELRAIAPYLLAADDKTLQALALLLGQPGARAAILRLSQLDLSLLAALQELSPADQALLLALAQKR